jgi:putative transposase
VELRLRHRPNRGWALAEDDAHRGRVQQGVPHHRGREEHHRGGCRKTLATLFERRGEPSFIRSDNGPEFIAQAVKRWLEASGVKTLYIEPGSPWENAYSETFISRLGDELLKREVFTNLLEAKVLVEEYRHHYNRERPHSALGYRTPAEFAAAYDAAGANEDLTKELESITALS